MSATLEDRWLEAFRAMSLDDRARASFACVRDRTIGLWVFTPDDGVETGALLAWDDGPRQGVDAFPNLDEAMKAFAESITTRLLDYEDDGHPVFAEFR